MGQETGKARTAPRGQSTTLDTTFHLKFVERLYDGSPRWWSNEWRKHFDKPSGKYGDRLEREPGVKQLIGFAADWQKFYNTKVKRLVTCVNPDCPVRAWLLQNPIGSNTETLNENAIRTDFAFDAGERNAVVAAVHDGMGKMSNGQFDSLPETCPNCPKKRAVFGLSDIKGKWVYVLKGTTSLTPFLEIFVKDPDSGSIRDYRNGRFTDETRPFDGELVLEKIKDFTWHFFLSPVRLGPRALAELSSSPGNVGQYWAPLLTQKPTDWKVGFIPALQPWTTTVYRNFKSRQLQTHYEYIPLVDPFSWVAQISEFDFLPILAAQQRLIQDSDEQAKAFVASTLAQEIGREKVSDGPPPTYSKGKDPWKVRDDTADPPDEFKSSGNIAQAWVDRYKSTLDYLTKETNFACSRVSYTVRFSLAHRIVETACQEDTSKSDSMAFGLTHWAHILQPMLACEAGKAFTVWAARNKDASQRIPQKNVLNALRGEGVGRGSKLGVEPSLPLQVFMYLSPVIVAGSGNPMQDLTQHLGKIDVDAAPAPGLENALALRDLTLSIGASRLTRYVESLPNEIDVSQLKKYSIAVSLQERIESFSTIKHVEDFLNLYTAFTGWSEKEKSYTSGWDELGERKEKIEKPVKVAEFISGTTGRIVKAGLKGDVAEIAEALENKGIASLTAEELEILKGSRALRAFKWAGIGEKLIAGPIGLVIGGLTLVIELGKTMEALESGDPGAAVAHGLQAASAALVIIVAGAECMALVSGAATAAWVGPVGWIAAALMLIGALVMYFCAKNDLQLYAKHCFLGEAYGEGGFDKTGKTWMIDATGTVMGWAELRFPKDKAKEDTERWQRQRMALLRILTGFSTSTTQILAATGYKPTWFITPSYIPPGAYFEVEVDFADNGGTKGATYYLRILPLAGNGAGDWVIWKGAQPGANTAIFTFRGSDGQISISVTIYHTYTNANYKESRVRLVYDTSARATLPATGWVENQQTDFGSNLVTSADAEGEKIESEDEKEKLKEIFGLDLP